MDKYHLTEEEDQRLRFSIRLPGKRGRSLYEYLTRLPLEDLQAYPKRGYHWWMGRAARSSQALALRDYILYWRLFAIDFRKQYPCEYLEKLPSDKMQRFLCTYIVKIPVWAYEAPIQDVIQLLAKDDEPLQ